MKKILYILIAALLFQGCEQFLDKVQDSTGMTEEMVFTDYLNARRFTDRMYKDIHNYLADYDYSFIAAFTDEGYAECDWETLPIIQSGDWLRAYNAGQALQFYAVWNGWQSIRIANLTIANVHRLLDGNGTQAQVNELKGQAHFMRAWYYWEFLRRQGGMPYITRALQGTDNFGLERLGYNETARMIAADCDTAASLLPGIWDNANMGRPTQGAAMALKASALLFAASPTNNPANDATRWTDAATAAWDLINLANTTGRYRLLPSLGTREITYDSPLGLRTITYPSGFDSIFMYTPYNDEIIWEHYTSVNAGNVWRTFTPKSLAAGGIIQGFSPSQNIVDMFETDNGLSITDDPGHDPQNPYINRDPRFYHSILFNRMKWTSNSSIYLELYEGGRDRPNTSDKHYSTTGYLARKFWHNNNDMWSAAAAPPTHVIYFRYAEILLMYAEACNEIGGPNYALPGASLTAVQALNEVRARVGMPGVAAQYLTSKETFRTRIKNERAVELFLEGKRLFDLSRWGDAHKLEHRAIYGVSLTPDPARPTGYAISRTSTPVITYVFDQKHYRWPIRTQDALMFREFAQNPGW